MSELILGRSLDAAQNRWGSSRRKPRSDRGKTRLHPAVERKLAALLNTADRPSISAIHQQLRSFCRQRGFPSPARSSVYNALGRAPVRRLAWDELPAAVRESLYNLGDDDAAAGSSSTTAVRCIPGDQVVFHAFNYGTPRAVSFASGLDWLSLHRASKRRGWRAKSRALLDAVLQYRRIP